MVVAVLTAVMTLGCASPISVPPETPPTLPASTAPTPTMPSAGPHTDLMAGYKAHDVALRAPDAGFQQAMADFSISLLQQRVSERDNVLISPLSVELALAMTANGAAGETLTQMQKVLGGGASIDDINAMLTSYVKGLPSTDNARFHFADSIWFKQMDGFDVKPEFLQTNADYYAAGVFAAPFDEGTINAINAWVSKNTDGMIPSILDELNPSERVVLLNALAFDAKWLQPYHDYQVGDDFFTASSGVRQPAKFMQSTEYTYLDDGRATGFVKPYADGVYNFVALLPNEGVAIKDYVASLTGDGWLRAMGSATGDMVLAQLPEFSFSYGTSLVDALKNMGMPIAFDWATGDFSRMSDGVTNISRVEHRTFIDVTPLGTRAGAATAVIIESGAVQPPDLIVTLDRPFVFAITDAATNLPIFIGVTNSIA